MMRMEIEMVMVEGVRFLCSAPDEWMVDIDFEKVRFHY